MARRWCDRFGFGEKISLGEETKMGIVKLNKGGRLEAKVTNFDGHSFTVAVQGKGHEDHGKEFTLPRTLWRGPGAVIGEAGYEGYAKEDPRSAPRAGDSVIYDSQVIEKAMKKSESSTEQKKA
jgi:hypothetical protein